MINFHFNNVNYKLVSNHILKLLKLRVFILAVIFLDFIYLPIEAEIADLRNRHSPLS